MTWLLCGEDELVKNWIIDRIDYVHRLTSYVAIGVFSGDRVIAGVAYHGYQPEYGTIQMSMAAVSPMWAKKSVIKRLLQYPFEQLSCYKVMIDIKINNVKALKTFKSIGFEREAVLTDVYGKGQHGAILQMSKPYYTQAYGGKKYDDVLIQTARKPEFEQEVVLNHSVVN